MRAFGRGLFGHWRGLERHRPAPFGRAEPVAMRVLARHGPIPRPSCHVEGRRFESHHPLSTKAPETGLFLCLEGVGSDAVGQEDGRQCPIQVGRASRAAPHRSKIGDVCADPATRMHATRLAPRRRPSSVAEDAPHSPGRSRPHRPSGMQASAHQLTKPVPNIRNTRDPGRIREPQNRTRLQDNDVHGQLCANSSRARVFHQRP